MDSLHAVQAWSIDHGVQIIIIFFVAFAAHATSQLVVERIVRKVVGSSHFRSLQAEKKREDTLIQIIGGTLKVFIWIIATMMFLSEIGVDIGPLLAAAGVAGLAIGFGGQYLIRDVVAGFFVIVENQYRVGDVACFDGTCGLVEDVTIRKTTLRDLDGVVHHIPHGVVTKVSNMTKDFSRVNLDLGVSYNADLEQVIEVINTVGQELANDEVWKSRIIDPIHFERVDEFADSAVIVKVLGDTEPLEQWAIAGEFRKRIKIAFDKAGIEIPFPQRVIHQVKS